MRVIGIDLICQECATSPEAAPDLRAWLAEARDGDWRHAGDVINAFPNAQKHGDGCITFALTAGAVALTAQFRFEVQVVLITEIKKVSAASQRRSSRARP